MKIGILGTGVVGRTIAGKLVELGHDVMVGTRDISKTLAHVNPDPYGLPSFSVWLRQNPTCKLDTFASAARHGELLVNATRGMGTLNALNMADESDLNGKILVDISNPLDFSKGMPPSLAVCNTDSLGEQVQRALPEVMVVKTLNTVTASLMVNPLQLASGEHHIFVSGNDQDAKAQVIHHLATWFGWKYILDLGDITTARGRNVFAYLVAVEERVGHRNVQYPNCQVGEGRDNHMETTKTLGRSNLHVPRLGIGAMIWGQPRGLARWTPAQLSYGPSHGASEEQRALEICLSAGVNLVDTAEMYSAGASERRVGELSQGKEVLIATKFPPSPFSRDEAYPKALEDSLRRLGRNIIDLYQVHYPSQRLSIPGLMNNMADAVEAGKVRVVGVSNYSVQEMRLAHNELAKRGIPLAIQPGPVFPPLSETGSGRGAGCLPRAGYHPHRLFPTCDGRPHRQILNQDESQWIQALSPNFNRKTLDAVQPVVELMRKIGERYGKSPSQVALRWLLENEIVLPIPGAKIAGRQPRMSVPSFSLTSDEVEELSQITLTWRK